MKARIVFRTVDCDCKAEGSRVIDEHERHCPALIAWSEAQPRRRRIKKLHGGTEPKGNPQGGQ